MMVRTPASQTIGVISLSNSVSVPPALIPADEAARVDERMTLKEKTAPLRSRTKDCMRFLPGKTRLNALNPFCSWERLPATHRIGSSEDFVEFAT